MNYALLILWHERQRYIPAMLAVTFSALLVALQIGLLIGTFSMVSMPIDNTSAHIWVAQLNVVSVDIGHVIPERWRDRLDQMPEIERTEAYIQEFLAWTKPGGGTENSIVIGCRLHEGALGAVHQLTPELRAKLAEPGSVVVDKADMGRLGLKTGVGEFAEVGGMRVRVVGIVSGLKGLGGPYVIGSMETARRLLRMPSDQVSYILARCHNPKDAPAVVEQLRRHESMSAYTSDQFSFRSRWYWLRMSGGGIALGCAAMLGLLVGAVVTSQTLYAATAASFREYAVLRALGVPRWRLATIVMSQSFWLGVLGVILAIPIVFALAEVARLLGARVVLAAWVLSLSTGLTMFTAMCAGLFALRSLRHLDLANLFG